MANKSVEKSDVIFILHNENPLFDINVIQKLSLRGVDARCIISPELDSSLPDLDAKIVFLESSADLDDGKFNYLVNAQIPTAILSHSPIWQEAREYLGAGAVDYIHFSLQAEDYYGPIAKYCD